MNKEEADACGVHRLYMKKISMSISKVLFKSFDSLSPLDDVSIQINCEKVVF